MKNYWLEVKNNERKLGLLAGDEVLISTKDKPIPNGKDIGLFELAGQLFLSKFTCYGSQILFVGEKVSVGRECQVKIIGKVISSKNSNKQR